MSTGNSFSQNYENIMNRTEESMESYSGVPSLGADVTLHAFEMYYFVIFIMRKVHTICENIFLLYLIYVIVIKWLILIKD